MLMTKQGSSGKSYLAMATRIKVLLFILLNVVIVASSLRVASSIEKRELRRNDDHGDDDYEPSENDIDVFFDLCNEFLDAMNDCGQSWMDLEGVMVDQIGLMSDRIVYTETLIIDEAEQIGIMADRIVETEYIMSNLTAQCMPICNESMNDKLANEDEYHKWRSKEPEQQEKESDQRSDPIFDTFTNKLATTATFSSAKPKEMCSPLSAFNEVLNESLIVFDQLCENVTDGIEFMTLQIGVMADRIVATECLIMDMSKQIGVMADRIVTTEELMSNLSASCCQVAEQPALSFITSDSEEEKKKKKKKRSAILLKDEPPTPPECANYTSSYDDLALRLKKKKKKDNNAALTGHKLYEKFKLPPKERSTTTSTTVDTVNTHAVVDKRDIPTDGPMPCDTWWNPFCCAMEIMTEMMKEMIDMMGSMGDQIIQLMESCSLLIGELADDIVDMEHEIMDMSLIIGEMADDIVDMEEWGAEMLNSAVCSHYSSSPSPSIYKDNRRKRMLSNVQVKYAPTSSSFIKPSVINILMNFDIHNTEMKLQLLKEVQEDEKYKKEKGGVFGDFADMVDLMIKMADTMTSLMTQELQEMNLIAKGIADMADQIVITMGLIGEMAQQINIMAGRIVETAQLMENLVDDCVPSS
jgi:hypothetical protein